MININNLTMGFTERTLFKDVTFSIFPNEKIGLTGPNGAGKTTLFHIILGDMESVAGNVQIQKNIDIGYLPQEAHFHSERTVMEEITTGDRRIKNLIEERRRLEEEEKAASARYGDVLHELEVLGIYDLEHRAEKILVGLGFKEEDFHKPINHLSGGWQMRTLLAKLLTHHYDLLLLDEPTNYLDLEATLWLKDFLKNYPGAFLLISHDRVFLNEITNYTILLEGSQMTKVKGNYETFEMQKGIQEKHLERQQKVVEKKRKQLEEFTQRFHAQPNRAAAVRNKRKMLERLEEIDIPQESKSIGEFEFSSITQSGYVVTRLQGIAKSYAEKKVYENVDLEIVRGQKICLVGPNGAGKSTLLKMIAGAIPPDSGTITHGHNVQAGYFSQSRLDVLNPNRNAFEEVTSAAQEGIQAVKVRTLLGLFNFHGDDVFKPVNVLSGGEKSRVILAKLLINPPNFMLLDEPTTHLDLDGVKALNNAFKNYDGTMVFISHDLSFIKEVANFIIEVNNGELKMYHGGLDYYLEKRKGDEQTLKDKEKALQEEGRRLKKEKKNDTAVLDPKLEELHRQHKNALNRIAQIKDQLKKLDREKQDLETESYVKSRQMSEAFGKNPNALKEFGQRLKDIQSRLREIESSVKNLKEEHEKISRK
ncbi:MAG: ATP-binding cassette domain-containing protein [Candidatus Omnitrophica bacterium]|nr:ATP-binding cassette domain-containing protein [Candidatus Omnitrophota bacterium]